MNLRRHLTLTLLAAALAACDAADMPPGAIDDGGAAAAVGSTVSVNAGGSATGSFLADAYYSGGSTYSTTNTIDTSQLTGAAPPQAVFQTERYGEFTYTIPNLTPNSAQTVTLYFQESFWTAAGQRTFNVAINGAAALTAFDIFAQAGGANRAIARTFATTASASGQVAIQLTRGGGPDNPKLCGLTLVEGVSAPTLTVNKAGSGSGTVTSSPAGISCGATCSATYAAGTSVTLTAAAASGSGFTGWSGACSGAAATCVVPVTAAQAVTATFTLGTTYALTVTRTGTGTGTVTSTPAGIACGSTCSASYASGTAVTLGASASTGSSFAGWSGACTGTGTCVVTMTDARSATARFDLVGNVTTTSVNAGGAASGSFAADAWYSGGSTYTTSNAIDTSQLPSPVPAQAVLQTERYGEFTYTVPNRAPGTAQTVTLYFEESYWTAAGQRTFQVAINGATVLSAFDIFAAAGGQNRAIARTFSTTANASGQVVIAFTKGGGPDNPKVCGITVSGEASASYTLSVTRSGSGSGTVTGGGISCGSVCSASVASGTTVTLTAAAAAGSSFTGWSGACSGAASTCVVSMTGAQSVTAAFGGGTYNPCPASGDCKILPFGDSITDGFNVAGGYRIQLFSTARAAGKRLTFVGSLVNGPTTVGGVTFPRNHEGHSGWTISQITNLVPSPALDAAPHIVLLMIGTNDMYGSSSGVPASIQRLDALLGRLVSAAPNALIVVAQITPLGDAGREALVRSYNAGLPAIVNARAAQGQHVVLVDQHTGFPTSELADGTHPNSAGYARMAGVWYAAIGPLLR